MAAIIRVKRRLDEDPAENLIVQYKKSKTDENTSNESAELCLSLVTTVKSKDAALSRPLQKTLRRQQLQQSYKTRNSKRVHQARAESSAKSKANRYRIVNSNRALESGSADLANTEAESSAVEPAGSGSESVAQRAGASDCASSSSLSDTDLRTNSGNNSESVSASSDSDDPVIHDVEIDSAVAGCNGEGVPEAASPSGCGITLNGQVMVSQSSSPAAESNYVYDLYYLNAGSQPYNFRVIENILSIEAFHDTLVAEADRMEECDDVYEDEDDSNDEDNWRNDYPDQDPDETSSDLEFDNDFLEGEESRSFKSALNDDLLAEEMGTRLRLFGSDASSGSDADGSDDDEDAYGDDDDVQRCQLKGSSLSAYMRHVKRELDKPVSDEDDDDDDLKSP